MVLKEIIDDFQLSLINTHQNPTPGQTSLRICSMFVRFCLTLAPSHNRHKWFHPLVSALSSQDMDCSWMELLEALIICWLTSVQTGRKGSHMGWGQGSRNTVHSASLVGPSHSSGITGWKCLIHRSDWCHTSAQILSMDNQEMTEYMLPAFKSDLTPAHLLSSDAEDWTQGFMYRQVLYHWIISLALLYLFWERFLLNCPACTQTWDLPASPSQVAGIRGVYHSAWLFLFKFYSFINIDNWLGDLQQRTFLISHLIFRSQILQ